MILLSGHSRTPARKVPLESMSLQMKERDSTAAMVPADMTGIGTESWFLDDTDPGSGLIWRVSSIGTDFTGQTPTVNLEFITATLRDRILFGEITPATITGNPAATVCSARQAAEYILRQQSDWKLGSFEFSVSNAYKFDGDSLFDALEAVTATLPDAWWSYDLTSYPFRISIIKRTGEVGSEMRCGRNLRTIRRTIDRSGMYTRFYPIGKDDLHLSPPYRDRNTAAYGVIEHTETDTSRETEAELSAWASERLSRHAEPQVTIEVEGLELAGATGEDMDRLKLGRMCRVPLPDFGTTITERVVGLSYPDKVNQPEAVTVTLANNRDDVTRIIAEAIRSSGRGGRGAARQSKEDHAWFEDTDEHVAMVAEGIIGTDENGNPNWTRLSQIIVDGEGIHQRVTAMNGDLIDAQSAIEQNEREIALRVTTAEAESMIRTSESGIELMVNDRVGEATSAITVEKGRIDQVVSAVGKDGQVTAASITLAINKNKSEAHIDADAVYIGNQKSTTVINGKVNTTDFNAVKARVDNLTGYTLQENYVGAKLVTGTTVTANNTFVHAGDTIYKRALRWTLGGAAIATVHATGDTTSIVLNHSHEMSVDASGVVTIGNAQVTTGNFNIADTAFYKAGVSAARTDGWDLARSFVSPPAEAMNASMDFGVPATTYNQASSYSFSVTDDGTYAYIRNALNRTVARAPLTRTYDEGRHDGWDLARGFLDPPAESTAHDYMEVGIPAANFNAGSSYRFTVSVDNNYAYIKNALNRTVARVGNVKTTSHSNCADSLTKSGAYNVLYAPDESGTTVTVKLKNISASGRYWYYRSSEQDLFTAYT